MTQSSKLLIAERLSELAHDMRDIAHLMDHHQHDGEGWTTHADELRKDAGRTAAWIAEIEAS